MLRLQVRGDAFLARIFDNDDAFKRLDFSLGDMTSSAAWVKVRLDLQLDDSPCHLAATPAYTEVTT